MKYMKFAYDFSKLAEDDYNYIKLPYANEGKKKVLFVLDHVPTEDMESGKLLSGCTGDVLEAVVNATQRLYKCRTKFSWLATAFNGFKTYGKAAEYRAQAEEAFADRIKQIICKYQPDYVVAFGPSVMRALLGKRIVQDAKGRTRYSYWMGVPVKSKFKVGGIEHTTTVVSNISLNDIVEGEASEASLLGYMCKCLAPVFEKTFLVDSEAILSEGSVVIDSIKRFDKLMDTLATKKAVSIDTEAKNLHKITNQLLTVQFAYNERKGFLLPVAHKDSPFTPKEVSYIHGRLRAYLEGENDNEYHIYTNAKFDLTLFRAECGVRYFANPVWDILGGEFALDENLKSLDTVLGEYYYSLGNLSVQYGYEGYLNAEFGKQHRANFAEADLTDEATIRYTTMDVCVPYAIHEVQRQRAKEQAYTRYDEVVLYEISDTIHAFSKMEHTGAGLDVNYLFYLRTEKSPIELEIQKMASALLMTKAAKQANKLLADKSSVPTTSLFGDALAATQLLRLNKPDHRRLFFFDVLKLAPLEKGKSGTGKINKKFQQHYAHVPEVAQFTALEKAKKLKNAYVSSFIKMLGESEDLQKDHRIRPDFGYVTVVTHRTSARNPNLQQVPAHSALGKHIKRLFIAREGTLYIKVDYRVHEVRGWGIIALDKAVAEVFAAAKKLRDEYRLNPSKELAKRIKVEADVHIQNVMIFFVKTLEQIGKMDPGELKKLRNAVKGVIFGFIYGMGIKAMSSNIGQDVDFTEKLLANFAKRFPKAVAWSKGIKKEAQEKLYVEAPNAIRRHLYGYLLPKSLEQSGQVSAQNDRQAGNAPVQGMCSKFMMNGIRILDALIFKQLLKDEEFELFISNSVHDSLENEAGYRYFIRSLSMIEWALTEGVKRKVKKRYGFELVSDLEIDFEIGASLSTTEAWDFSVAQLDRLVMDSLLFQRNKLKYKVVVEEAYGQIFSKHALTNDAPAWMKTQIENTGYKFKMTEKEYIRELLNMGKAAEAEGEKLLNSEDPDIVKKGKSMVSEGKDLIEYARELNEFRKEHV